MVKCRYCNQDTRSVLDLGEIHPSNFIEEGEESEKFPLHLVECSTCGLVQLNDTYDLDKMYRQYWYKSGLNPSMRNSLLNVVTSVNKDKVKLFRDDKVLDIGCNDGTLLSFYGPDIVKVGIDPAENLANEARRHCNYFVNDYFSYKRLEEEIPHIKHKYKIIYSIAMFYDIPDINKFMEDITACLHPYGVWVIQFTDLISMLSLNAFDNICHEHLEYYSLSVLNMIMERHGLEIFDVEYNKVNGGSIRAYVGWHEERAISQSVRFFINSEKAYLGQFDDPLAAFARRVKTQKLKLLTKLTVNKGKGKVYGLGASTKGNTLLQYYGIDNKMVEKIAEVNEDKFGLKTAGTNIPIIPEQQALEENPDYFLVLPWHFREFFVKTFEDYLEYGGNLIFPLPEVEVV